MKSTYIDNLTKELNNKIKTDFEIFKVNHQTSRKYGKYALMFILHVLSFTLIYLVCYQGSTSSPDDFLYFLLILYIGNFYFLYYNIIPLIRQYQSLTWKKIEAKINQIEKFPIKTITRYSFYIEEFPYIQYSYMIKDNLYTNNKLSFHLEYSYNKPLTSNTSILFEQWLKKNRVIIYYNPLNPKEAVVFRKFTSHMYIFYSLVTILHSISIIGLTCVFIKSF